MTSSASLNILLFGMGGIGSTYAFLFNSSSLPGRTIHTHVVARSNHAVLASETGLKLDSVKFGQKSGIKFAGVWKSAAEAEEGVGEEGFDYIVCEFDDFLCKNRWHV